MQLINIKKQMKLWGNNTSYWGAYHVWAVIYYHNRYTNNPGFTRVQWWDYVFSK